MTSVALVDADTCDSIAVAASCWVAPCELPLSASFDPEEAIPMTRSTSAKKRSLAPPRMSFTPVATEGSIRPSEETKLESVTTQ